MNNTLVFIAVLAMMAMIALNHLSAMITQKLGSIRDPLQIWNALQATGVPIRIRAWIFSSIVANANPYAQTINFRITELRKGTACGVMKETKQISNPFECVHAAALITFGEMVGELALLSLLGKNDRVVLTNINTEYVKVSRGLLTASSIVAPLKDREATEVVSCVLIKNASFETVSKLTLTWKVDLQSA